MTLTKDKPKVGRTTLAHARKELTALDLPYDGTKHILIGKRYILFVTVDPDQDCSNPCDDDGVGQIRSLSNRHINQIDYDEAKELLEQDADVIPLSYFEHGNCVWMVAGSAATNTPGIEFQWDGVRFAGVWIPDDSVRESYTAQDGLSRRDWMIKQAECACEQYTQWANGECYYYSVQLYKARYSDDGDLYDDSDDYRYETAIEEDSCGGFIGYDYAKENVLSAAKDALDSLAL